MNKIVFILCFCSVFFSTISLAINICRYDFARVIGNKIENMRNLKNDCEKDLPRNQECVLVYEYVATSKE